MPLSFLIFRFDADYFLMLIFLVISSPSSDTFFMPLLISLCLRHYYFFYFIFAMPICFHACLLSSSFSLHFFFIIDAPLFLSSLLILRLRHYFITFIIIAFRFHFHYLFRRCCYFQSFHITLFLLFSMPFSLFRLIIFSHAFRWCHFITLRDAMICLSFSMPPCRRLFHYYAAAFSMLMLSLMSLFSCHYAADDAAIIHYFLVDATLFRLRYAFRWCWYYFRCFSITPMLSLSHFDAWFFICDAIFADADYLLLFSLPILPLPLLMLLMLLMLSLFLRYFRDAAALLPLLLRRLYADADADADYAWCFIFIYFPCHIDAGAFLFVLMPHADAYLICRYITLLRLLLLRHVTPLIFFIDYWLRCHFITLRFMMQHCQHFSFIDLPPIFYYHYAIIDYFRFSPLLCWFLSFSMLSFFAIIIIDNIFIIDISGDIISRHCHYFHCIDIISLPLIIISLCYHISSIRCHYCLMFHWLRLFTLSWDYATPLLSPCFSPLAGFADWLFDAFFSLFSPPLMLFRCRCCCRYLPLIFLRRDGWWCRFSSLSLFIIFAAVFDCFSADADYFRWCRFSLFFSSFAIFFRCWFSPFRDIFIISMPDYWCRRHFIVFAAWWLLISFQIFLYFIAAFRFRRYWLLHFAISLLMPFILLSFSPELRLPMSLPPLFAAFRLFFAFRHFLSFFFIFYLFSIIIIFAADYGCRRCCFLHYLFRCRQLHYFLRCRFFHWLFHTISFSFIWWLRFIAAALRRADDALFSDAYDAALLLLIAAVAAYADADDMMLSLITPLMPPLILIIAFRFRLCRFYYFLIIACWHFHYCHTAVAATPLIIFSAAADTPVLLSRYLLMLITFSLISLHFFHFSLMLRMIDVFSFHFCAIYFTISLRYFFFQSAFSFIFIDAASLSLFRCLFIIIFMLVFFIILIIFLSLLIFFLFFAAAADSFHLFSFLLSIIDFIEMSLAFLLFSSRIFFRRFSYASFTPFRHYVIYFFLLISLPFSDAAYYAVYYFHIISPLCFSRRRR